MKILILLHVCLALVVATVNGKVFKQCQGIAREVYIAGQSGCRSFIYCNGESSYESFCPIDSAFNPFDGTCDDPDNVDCHDETVQPIPEEPKIVCPLADEIIFLSSPDSCEEYYMCYSGTPIALTCSNHLHFNAQKQSCDFPKSANCKLSGNTEPTTNNDLPTTTYKPTPSLPASTTNSDSTTPTYKPTPSLPETTTLSTTRKTPPQPTATQPQPPTTSPQPTARPPQPPTTSPAQPPTTSARPTTTTPRSTITTTTTTPHPTTTTTTTSPPPTTTTTEDIEPPTPGPLSTEELCKQHWVGNFPYPEDCRFYYRCMNGLLSKQECPSGYGWDGNKKMCTTTGCSTARK